MHHTLVKNQKNLSTPGKEHEVRAHVPQHVREVLDKLKETTGLDHKQIVARILVWLSGQDGFVRAALLGQFPVDEQIANMIAERMKTSPPRKGSGSGGTAKKPLDRVPLDDESDAKEA